MAALVALARIGSLGGLVAPPPGARRLDAAAFASLLWTVAVALPAVRALGPRRAAELDPVSWATATVTASLGSLGLAIASAYRVLAGRRLELRGIGREITHIEKSCKAHERRPSPKSRSISLLHSIALSRGVFKCGALRPSAART